MEDYCIALFCILFFVLIFMDGNTDGFDNMKGASLDDSDDSDDSGYHGSVDHSDTIDEHKPIGQVPFNIQMNTPASMDESMNMLSGAPVGAPVEGDFMLLSNDISSGVNVINSQVHVDYPRVGGPGNLGKGLYDDDDDDDDDDGEYAEYGSHSDYDGSVVDHGSIEHSASSGSGKSLDIVAIWAPWCGWSKKSLPDFEKMEQSLNSLPSSATNGWDVSFKLYNSEKPDGKDMVKQYEVKGFPSVFVEVDGSRMEGPRDYDEMVSLINSKTGGSIN